mgnify:CR=1 FL=1
MAGDRRLRRAADPGDRRKVIYSLTPKGEALLPVVLALRQWGQEWGHGSNDRIVCDTRDGKPIRKIAILAHDGRELALDELMWMDKDGNNYRRPEPILPASETVSDAA